MQNGDPRKMTARFKSKCVESGATIHKGDPIIYYPRTRKVFKIGSAPKQEKDFAAFQVLAYEEDNGHCYY